MKTTAPETSWERSDALGVVVRFRLCLNGKQTPYFVDKAKHARHFTAGQPVGLFGSGLHPSGCAATLGAFGTVRAAKAAALAEAGANLKPS